MTYDYRGEAEIAILADVLAILADTSPTALGSELSDTDRAQVFAEVLYELIVSARTVVGPDTGRLYAAPVLDSILDNAPAAEEVSALDLLIPALIAHRATPAD
ncbi:hypothetical protein AB0C34_27565 [Nocardia sp. NPDC049220]|uniref:hypothetical protein n=1 Tax=Nocardia sp. NPDC049220 TaxID=3155273 RepID=UPI0033C44F46